MTKFLKSSNSRTLRRRLLNNVSVAGDAMQAFDGTIASVVEAKDLIDDHAALVDTAQGSEFTMSVIGLVDDALDWI